jgi:NAD(P)H-dependent flavin oxidoreductase YrpB (nitropropane dioxygenase family)
MVLVPAVCDAVSVPVVAAGGIADGRGLAAALALGADGGWVGTRFLLAEEAPIHPDFRRLLLAAAETDTFHAPNLFHLGWEDAPHRALRNSTYSLWLDAGRPPVGSRPGEGEVVATRADGAPLLRYSSSLPLVGMGGEVEALSLYAGQSVGLVAEVRSAAAIVAELAADAQDVVDRLHVASHA